MTKAAKELKRMEWKDSDTYTPLLPATLLEVKKLEAEQLTPREIVFWVNSNQVYFTK